MTLLVGETRGISLNDDVAHGGRPVKADSWKSSDTRVLTITGNEPILTAVSSGKVTITATYAGESAEARLVVMAGTELPPGTIKWSVPAEPGMTTLKIIQAEPGAAGGRAPMPARESAEKTSSSVTPRSMDQFPEILSQCRRVQPGMKKSELDSIFAPGIVIKPEMYAPAGLRVTGRDIDCQVIFDAQTDLVRRRKIIFRDPNEP